MFSIDQYSYTNKLRTVHPGEKFTFAMLTLVICLAASSMVTSLLVFILMSLTVTWRAGIPCRVYTKFMSIPVSFLVIGVLTIAFNVTQKDYNFLAGFAIGGFEVGFTSESIKTAAGLLLKSLGAVSCLYFLSLTTPMIDMINVFRKMRVPALFVELMTLIYRFIFVLAETAQRMHTAQSSRLGYVSLKHSFFSLSQLASTLFVKSLHRSQLLFQALSSRCYTGGLNVIEAPYTLCGKNLILIAVLEIGLVVISLYSGGGLL